MELILIFPKVLARQALNNQEIWILALGYFGKGVASMDAGAKPCMSSRRPLTEYPSVKSRWRDETFMQELLGRLINYKPLFYRALLSSSN